jgi:putative flavoprotein involved in K+ transport
MRYDRLHLHTVRWLSCRPGYRIPRAFGKWLSGDRVLEYLQGYVERHALDVRTGVEVERIDRGSVTPVRTSSRKEAD